MLQKILSTVSQQLENQYTLKINLLIQHNVRNC